MYNLKKSFLIIWLFIFVLFLGVANAKLEENLKDSEFEEALERMSEHGLTQYDEIDSFMPWGTLTREQAASFFNWFASSIGKTVEQERDGCEFGDIDMADDTLKDDIKAVCNLGIMRWSDNKFSPKNNITRAEFFTVAVRVLDGMHMEDVNPWWAHYFETARDLELTQEEDVMAQDRNILRYEAGLILFRWAEESHQTDDQDDESSHEMPWSDIIDQIIERRRDWEDNGDQDDEDDQDQDDEEWIYDFEFDEENRIVISYNPEEIWVDSPELEWWCKDETTQANNKNSWEENTIRILNQDCEMDSEEKKAAEYCSGLEVWWYSDWYLPSEGELKLMYENKEKLGGSLGESSVWSSTETDSESARIISRWWLLTTSHEKDATNPVHCVRSEFDWNYADNKIYQSVKNELEDEEDVLKEKVESTAEKVYYDSFEDVSLSILQELNTDNWWDYVSSIHNEIQEDYLDEILGEYFDDSRTYEDEKRFELTVSERKETYTWKLEEAKNDLTIDAYDQDADLSPFIQAFFGEDAELEDVQTWTVREDINLPDTQYEADITWESDNEDIIDDEGNVTRPDYGEQDAEVTLTATLEVWDVEWTKEFPFQVPEMKETDEEKLEEAKEDLELEQDDDITMDIYLPDSKYEADITWESDNEDIIDNEGNVTRPDYGEQDTEVTLTANLEVWDAEDTKEFVLEVPEVEQTNNQRIEEAKESLELDVDKDNIKEDIYLPSIQNEAGVTWESSDENIINNEGEVTRPDYGEQDAEVVLTGTLLLEESRNENTVLLQEVLEETKEKQEENINKAKNLKEEFSRNDLFTNLDKSDNPVEELESRISDKESAREEFVYWVSRENLENFMESYESVYNQSRKVILYLENLKEQYQEEIEDFKKKRIADDFEEDLLTYYEYNWNYPSMGWAGFSSVIEVISSEESYFDIEWEEEIKQEVYYLELFENKEKVGYVMFAELNGQERWNIFIEKEDIVDDKNNYDNIKDKLNTSDEWDVYLLKGIWKWKKENEIIYCKWKEPGSKEEIEWKEYTAVDWNLLEEWIEDGKDLSKACTSNVNDMSWEVILSQDGTWIEDIKWFFGDWQGGVESFDEDITSWDVSNVVSMNNMFKDAESFDQDIGNWDVGNVENMESMFEGAESFDQDIGNWDVANVENMKTMFKGAESFDQDIGNWDVSNVENMISMFEGTNDFDYDLKESWNVDNVKDCEDVNKNSELEDHNIPDFQGCYEWYKEDGIVYCGEADVGSEKELNWKEYTAVYREMLEDWIEDGKDLSKACTSNVNDLSWEEIRDDQEEEVEKVEWLFEDWQGGVENFDEDITSWDVSNVENMNNMFKDASSFDQDISNWDTSNVGTIRNMFRNATSFDQDIGSWDTSNIVTTSSMFSWANSFNQDIGDWDVGSVENMHSMFRNADSFNQDIWDWDTSSVDNMYSMFRNAESFDKDIWDWDIGNVDDTSYMFKNANSFSQDIWGWSVGNVENMESMFEDANNFNQDLWNWNLGNVENMSNMFRNADSFNQNIADWQLGNVEDLSWIFRNANSFNYDIWDWELNNVENMESMFEGADSFNRDISEWDVSNVENMESMFEGADSFNRDISNWDVSNIENMIRMFKDAEAFNKDLSNWCVEQIEDNKSHEFADWSWLENKFNKHPDWWDDCD